MDDDAYMILKCQAGDSFRDRPSLEKSAGPFGVRVRGRQFDREAVADTGTCQRRSTGWEPVSA